ncbi:Cloroperoxidase [Apiospora rasikravindrae]|uniref:Cloroperoxidase n=1 Tax=Apiospora rasikravindrae TaxID=990691 RepID=A0ABR1UAL3_9PEZI
MKTFLIAILAAAAVSSAGAATPGNEWSPPGPGNVRGPCPGLNTLANHGFLPRDGRDIDADTLSNALKTGLNADSRLAGAFFASAIPTNPAPNATTFSLSDLTRHNILEHDGSLSRQDAHFARADLLDPTIWAETQSHFPDPVVSLAQAARARQARIDASNRTNPDFALSDVLRTNSLLETAIYLIAFGDREAATIPKETLVYFFENERFPPGWERADKAITLDELTQMAGRVAKATTAAGSASPVDGESLADGHSDHSWAGREDL